MYREILYNPNMFTIPKEIKGNDLEFLFFDYLPNLSLLDYLIDIKKGIKEIHIKYLCYKLLMAIKNLHENNICHNAINISNILFDDNYDPKIIHFSEAKIIWKKTLLNNDLFRLGQTLAKIISLGKLESIVYNKKTKIFKIKSINKAELEEEATFWKKLKITDNIYISEQFTNFFHLLIDTKISNNLIEIEEIMKNKWLNEVNYNLVICQKNFENDFKIMHETIMENRNEENKIEIDINNIININQKKDNNLSYNYFNNNLNMIPNMKMQPMNNNYNSLNNNMNIFYNNMMTNNNKYNNNNTMMNNNIYNNIIMNNSQHNNNAICDHKDYLGSDQLIMEEDDIKMNKYNNMTNNLNMNYFNKNIFLNPEMEIDLISKIKRNNVYNILELNIKNYYKTEKDIKYALVYFMKAFRYVLINTFHIHADYVNEDNISFNIKGFKIPFNHDDHDEIIFLDEKFEQIVKYGLNYQIKVKIIQQFIYQYYMVFEGINFDKEYFYRYIKEFKVIAKALLKGRK